MHLRLNALISGWLFGVAVLVAGRASAQKLSADEIVNRMMEKNAQRRAELQHYVSDRTYTLTYSGTGGDHHAEMAVRAEYAAPGHKKLTIMAESGSKVLCAEVLRKLVEGEQETADKADWARAMFSPDTYTLQLLGQEQLDGIVTWVLHVDPKSTSRVGYRGKLWVSADDYAMVRLQAEPAKNPSWFVSHPSFDAWYMRRGDVWVPERNISTTHVRIGGDAKVTIDYGQYAVLSTTPSNAPNLPIDKLPTRGSIAKKIPENSLH
jgi:hypothetical protein